ncbi:MAG: BMP family ABC transporter substrate-binding protein [Chloroflexi bacterium]|uniref:BMP family ABC transporter substrate-binding protein n=1 Tax=Candidatus Chlorohelix allophototropha TaxID=3003348 RepID=A0A8T7M870_9CHLR|nr:BMP family ABC transporter substrate-binding protein [Chloroflexota bacterium]WJW68177.1 BMP family ABC transporter substrate-binding protein [Chloroflexota bacterium L227-S17]
MRNSKKAGLLAGILLLVTLLLAACGDSTATTAPATTSAATTAAKTTAAATTGAATTGASTTGVATTTAGATTAGATTAAGTTAASGTKFKVAFVYVGPVGDGGWTYAHDQGRKYLEQNVPNVETTFIENVPENPADAERVITDLAQKGNKMIFTTSFGYMDPTINVAKKFPNVYFEHATGYKTAENVATYQVRQYQPRYLAGIVAGKLTKTNLIGYVAAYPIPEVIGGIDAFTLGVRSVNPTAKVKVVWTNTWYDPAIEKTAAKSLLDAGCDILGQHQDTPSTLQAAQEAGKYAFGNDSIMESYAPKAHLASPYWNWGIYYVDRVKAAIAGTWKSGEYFGGYKEGVVDLSPLNTVVPDDVKKLVEDKKAALKAGTFEVYAGPIKDQKGAVKVAEGAKLTDADILALNYFFEGVDGTIPS